MSLGYLAANPTALTNVGANVTAAAAAVPRSCPASASVGDPAADAALHEFLDHWSTRLDLLEQAARTIAGQARLTAVAFTLAGA